MFQGQTDKDWEFYGKNEPYFGVVTWDKFKSDSLDETAKDDFFQTGAAYIQQTVEIIKENFSADFYPKKALDFGCGVGRLVIPLAANCETVTGVDVSVSMLKEAKQNCEKQGIQNVNFVQGDDGLSKVSGTFDFIHSFIVFQHIPVARGEKIVCRLLELLDEGGIGALHFTFSHNFTPLQSFKYQTYKRFPFLWSLKNAIRQSHPGPMLQMNLYNLNTIFRLLQAHGCHQTLVRFSLHGTSGVILYFQKKPLPMF